MLKKILIVIGLTFSFVVMADVIQVKDEAPKTYVVKKGDTLWDIAGVFLNQQWLWPKLWRFNPEISNPHLIYPGDELRLVFDADGNPMLVRGKTELKWSPKIRTQRKDLTPINTVSFNDIAPYINYDSVLSAEDFDQLPYILGDDSGYKSSVDGAKLYIKGELPVGKGYGIYKRGEVIIDPISEEILGYHAILTGIAKSIRTGDNSNNVPSTLYLDSTKQEVQAGQYVVEINDEKSFPGVFTMKAGELEEPGAIIQAFNNATKFSRLDVVMINKGSQDNVTQGDVLLVNRASPDVLDTPKGPLYRKESSVWNRLILPEESAYKMPDEELGRLMVFKVYDKLSVAIVLSSTKPLRLLDSVSSPEK